MADRSSMIANAVAFLRDPDLQSTPLDKRLAFLQTKGLSATEIEEALTQAGLKGVQMPASSIIASSIPASSSSTSSAPNHSAMVPPMPPMPNLTLQSKLGFSWRRFFVMIAVATSAALALSQSMLPGWISWLVGRVKRHLGWNELEVSESTGWIRESFQSIKKDLKDLLQQQRDAKEEMREAKQEMRDAKEEMRRIREDLEQGELRMEQQLNLQRLAIQDQGLAYSHLQSELDAIRANLKCTEVYHDAADNCGGVTGGLVA